jgi:hypothetical protein
VLKGWLAEVGQPVTVHSDAQIRRANGSSDAGGVSDPGPIGPGSLTPA